MKIFNKLRSFLLILGISAFAASANAGSVPNTRITGVGSSVSTTSVPVVVLTLSSTVTNPPPSTGACTGRVTNRMAIDISNPVGQKGADFANSALLSRLNAGLIGTGTCLTVPFGGTNIVMETVSQLSYLDP